ncbi:MAG TPA: type II toxin-antitoxin system HicA family toxin [Hanamia sp.]|nr:type II toxin-antitoxin system HicA family toxin [Hanamia sp.]
MRIPPDISAKELILRLKKYGYEVQRQKGSHIRLITLLEGTHHVTVPNHNSIKIGTLSGIMMWQLILINLKKK